MPVLVHARLVYTAGRAGSDLRAYALSCRRDGGTCRPRWRGAPGPWPAGAAAAGGRLFVPAADRVVFFDLPCRTRRCRPAGALTIPDPLISGYPEPGRALPANGFRVTAARGTLFVTAEVDLGEGSGIRAGRLLAYDPRCAPPCRPLWWSPPGRGLGAPTVRGGRVYLPASSGLSAFIRCPRTGSRCQPTWTAPMNTRRGLMTMNPPAVGGGLVVALTEGCVCGAESDAPMLAAFPADRRGRSRPAWSASLPGRFAAGPVLHGGSAFAVASGAVFRFPLACGDPCRAEARFALPAGAFPRTPVVVGGSLLVPTFGRGSRVSAFRPRCAGRCAPFASWDARGPAGAALRVGRRLLFAAGRTVSLLPPPRPGTTWEPEASWELPRRVEAVIVHGRVALVGAGGWTYALRLP